MIELTHTSAPPMGYKVCTIDFEIWDTVLRRRPGWRLETMSHQLARADAALMFSLVDSATDNGNGSPPASHTLGKYNRGTGNAG